MAVEPSRAELEAAHCWQTDDHVGIRLPVEYARATGATFLTAAAHDAATFRRSAGAKEPHQSLDATRTWADLLWPTAFSFNLFGELGADLELDLGDGSSGIPPPSASATSPNPTASRPAVTAWAGARPHLDPVRRSRRQ